jgi:hypothetical protein
VKKTLAILLGMLFVLGLTANAFAIHADIPSETQAAVAKGSTQVTFDGELRFRGWMLNNISTTNLPIDSPTTSFYDSRVRLGIEAKVSPNTTGYVQLESGAVANTDTFGWGNINGKPATTINFLQAWVLHTGSGLLGVPAGVKVGHMPLALSQRQFLDHTKFGDDAIVIFADPIKGLHIGLVNAKFAEGVNSASKDDINGYVALATYKWNKDNTVGVNYALVSATDTPGVGGATDGGVSFQNVGLHANGMVSGLTYEAEFDTQFGKANKGAGAGEVKFSGYGVFANVAYKLNPVNLRAGFAMGSGDSDLTDTKVKEFQTTMGRDLHYSFIYEYFVQTAAMQQAIDTTHSAAGTGRSTGIANTTYYRLGLDYAPTKDITTSLDGFIIRATKAPAGVKKDVGAEVDLKIAYKVDRNLTYSVLAGWFNAGDFYGAAKKDSTAMMHALTLSF